MEWVLSLGSELCGAFFVTEVVAAKAGMRGRRVVKAECALDVDVAWWVPGSWAARSCVVVGKQSKWLPALGMMFLAM